jgi:hypothetical protein
MSNGNMVTATYDNSGNGASPLNVDPELSRVMQTGTYVLTGDDNGAIFTYNGTGTLTLQVNPNIGDLEFTAVSTASGTITISAVNGATLSGVSSAAVNSSVFVKSVNNTAYVGIAQNNAFRGTTTNNNAAAGIVGEVIQANLSQATPTALTSGTAANVTSITLTAGDWEIDSTIEFTLTGATVTDRTCSLSTTTATHGTFIASGSLSAGGRVQKLDAYVTASGIDSVTIKRTRISLSAGTTLYLVASATFSAGTVGVSGTLYATRRR